MVHMSHSVCLDQALFDRKLPGGLEQGGAVQSQVPRGQVLPRDNASGM